MKRGEYVGGSPKIYAFIKYFDSKSVIIAILKMNGVTIEGCRVRLGFGKTYPSKCVWITSIDEFGDNNNFLLTCLAEFGTIENYSIDHINKRALVNFKEVKFNLIIYLLIFVYVSILIRCQILINC